MAGRKTADRNADGLGRSVNHDGYVRLYAPGHPSANSARSVAEHIYVVEKAVGRQLRNAEEVHHVNGIRSDNRNENLVACQDRAFHFLLHRRARALAACGHVDWRKCPHCGVYGDPATMYRSGTRQKPVYGHRACKNAYSREWKAKRKAVLSRG